MIAFSDNQTAPMLDLFRRRTTTANLSDEPPAIVDDGQLVALLHERPAEGIAQLYERYGRLVFSMALRVVQDYGIAEEITQDVFVRCWRSIDSYQSSRGSLASWLLTIAHHRAIDVLRSRQGKERQRAVSSEYFAFLAATDPALDELLIRRDVQKALGELPEAQREVIELVYWGGLTRREIADQLQIPLGTVHTRLRLGIHKLRSLLTALLDIEKPDS